MNANTRNGNKLNKMSLNNVLCDMLSCINPIEMKFSSQEFLAAVLQTVYDIPYKDVMNLLNWNELNRNKYGNHVVSTNMLTKSTFWDDFERGPFVLSDVYNLYV